MLISKFNRLIRSKVLWTVFAVIISISFVGTFTKSGGCSMYNPNSNKAYGKEILPNDLSQARYFELGFRKSANLTEEMDKMLTRKAWERIAILGLAQKMQISASEAEIDNAIKTDPAFSANGEFSLEKLSQIVEKQLGMDMQTFRLYFKQELILRKMSIALSASSMTSPYEMNNKISNLSDQFTVQYAVLKRSSMTNRIEVSKNDALTFFNENMEYFKVPEKVVVNYIKIPASNYLAKAEPTEDQIKDYYEQNKDTEFTTTDTNGTDTVKSFDAAKPDISAKIKKSLAYEMAKNSALEFVVDLQEDKYGKSLNVTDALKKHDLHPQKSQPFSMHDSPDWSDAGSDLLKAAFAMDFAQTNNTSSDVIEGKANVYVLIPLAKKDSYYPTFEEVQNKVLPLATTNLINKSFSSYAGDMKEKIAKSVASGKSFDDASKAVGLKTQTSEAFNVYTGFTNENDYADLIIGAVMNLEKGEVANPVFSKDTGLICYIKDRTPASAVETEMLKPEVASALEKYRTAVIINDWRKKVFLDSGIKDAKGIETAENKSDQNGPVEDL